MISVQFMQSRGFIVIVIVIVFVIVIVIVMFAKTSFVLKLYIFI